MNIFSRAWVIVFTRYQFTIIDSMYYRMYKFIENQFAEFRPLHRNEDNIQEKISYYDLHASGIYQNLYYIYHRKSLNDDQKAFDRNIITQYRFLIHYPKINK